MTEPDCVFCKIVAGELPSMRIAEDDRTIAFMASGPATPGHTLVIPKAHARDLLSVGADDLTACMLAARRVAGHVVDRLDADGVNLMNNCGAAAWQTVFHFHVHVIPRYAHDPGRDDLKLPWVPEVGDMDAIAAVHRQLTA